MKVQTHSPRAVQARKTIVELLLANHPDDCLYCSRNGNCQLQELAEELGVRQRRFAGDRSAALHRHVQPLDRPRSGQVHPLRQMRAGLRGNPARRRPSISSAAARKPRSARPSTKA